MEDEPPGGIVVVRRQLGNSDDMHNEYDLREGIRQGDNKFRRGASVSGEPIDHAGVGVVIVGLQRTTLRMSFPVRVCEPLGVLVVRIAGVGVLERCLSERKQQACYYTEMDQSTNQVTYFTLRQVSHAAGALPGGGSSFGLGLRPHPWQFFLASHAWPGI